MATTYTALPLHGLSRDVTLAVLPRLFTEELVAELTRRNISFGGHSFEQEVLVAMLNSVMRREYRNLEAETNVAGDRSFDVTPDTELAEREEVQCQVQQKHSRTLPRVCPSPTVENSPSTEVATHCHDDKYACTYQESQAKYEAVCLEDYPDVNASYNNSRTYVSTNEDQTIMAASEDRETSTSPTTLPTSQLGYVCSTKTIELQDSKIQNDEMLYSIDPGFQSGKGTTSQTQEVTTMVDPNSTVFTGQHVQVDLPMAEPVTGNSDHVNAYCNDDKVALCMDANGEIGSHETGFERYESQNVDGSDSHVLSTVSRTSDNDPSTCLEPQDTMLYACNKCDYRTKVKYSFVRHTRVHTGEKPYMCPYCDYRAGQNAHLKIHMLRHSGVKPYKCSDCDFRALQKFELVRHMRKHTGEKPFMCGECGFRTAHKNSIDLHMKRHTGDKPHVCNVCGYRTPRKADLLAHQRRRHTGEKPSAEIVATDSSYEISPPMEPISCDQ